MQQNSENHVNFHLFFVWHIHAENGNSMNSTHSMNDVIINEFIKIPKMTSPYPFTSMIYPKLNSWENHGYSWENTKWSKNLPNKNKQKAEKR